MRKRLCPLALTALVVLGALAFVACSSGDGDPADQTLQTSPTLTSPTSPGGDPGPRICNLLSAAELSHIAGEPMGNPSSLSLGPPLGQRVCTFGALSGGSYTIAQVSVVAQGGLSIALLDDGFTVQRLFDETFTMFPNAVLVPGIGDAAFRHDNTLEVLAGDVAFSVSLAYNDGTLRHPASLETLVALATIVLDRIEIPS